VIPLVGALAISKSLPDFPFKLREMYYRIGVLGQGGLNDVAPSQDGGYPTCNSDESSYDGIKFGGEDGIQKRSK
jgi:hypothetical protein